MNASASTVAGLSQPIAEEDLRFDARNPRLADEEGASQEELLETLWRDFAVDEVALSIAANGYFPHEPLFATREHGELVVIEGNRRLGLGRLAPVQPFSFLPLKSDAANDQYQARLLGQVLDQTASSTA